MTSFINDRGKTPATGNVAGAASSTDNAVSRFDGTGGKTLQNSGVIIDDSDNVTGVATLKATTTIGVGAATPAASGAGITFPATQSASSDANTLDDYEEGTWTPTDQSGASLSFSSATGTYTKIGRICIAGSFIVYPSTASGAGCLIGGLPFTVSGSGNAPGRQGHVSYSNSAFNTWCIPSAGSTNFFLHTSAGVQTINSQMSTNATFCNEIYPV